ncbi:hypothetical protein [Dechloromonas sp. H13]|uniref:hypothetical protein n=1 Tax=Dechloromonas sp. H13 TaxID=2570193 RepID=UPI0012921E8E|nr:hypothetical protein [Dechloromonas sp. H13]
MLEILLNLTRSGGQKMTHPLTDSRALRRVIDEIPGDNAFKALDQIVGWLESLQGVADFPEDRLYEAVSRLHDAAQPHLKRLARDYLHSPRLSRSEEKCLWTISHGFWIMLALSYERCLPPAGAKMPGAHFRQVLPALCARLIAALGNVLKWEQFHYMASTGDLWQRLGAALLVAERAGGAGRESQSRDAASDVGSPQLEFAKVVAFHAASLENLLPLQIELAERLITHFSPGFVFSAEVDRDSVYWVDLAHAGPPTRLARRPQHAEPTQRFFKPAKAHAAILKLIHDLEKGLDVPGHVIPGGQYDAQTLLPVLRHLSLHLASVPPQRRNKRYSVKQRALVVNGLDNVRMVFSGNHAGLGIHLPMESWVVEDVSRGGFGAVLNSIPGEWLKVGALIAMQPEGGATWQLGIVRRCHRLGESDAQIGIEMLALHGTPVDLRMRVASTFAAVDSIPALMIREGNAAGEVRVVMPLASFNANETLEYEEDGQYRLLTPVAFVEQAADCELARYRKGASG